MALSSFFKMLASCLVLFFLRVHGCVRSEGRKGPLELRGDSAGRWLFPSSLLGLLPRVIEGLSSHDANPSQPQNPLNGERDLSITEMTIYRSPNIQCCFFFLK